jgi:protein-tyrosine phosphatase
MKRHSRKLRLEGASNVRDLGGYATGTAGATRWNACLRGDSLHRLTPADIKALLDHGVRTVIDLREPIEAEKEPSRLRGVPGVTVHQVPLLATLSPALGGAGLPIDLGELYVLCLRHGGVALKRVFELFGADGGGAVLFHCAVGKDRTGVVAALLLDLLGVSRKQILEDYTASGENLAVLAAELVRRYERNPAEGVHPDLLRCNPRNMERMLDVLQAEYGGAAGYLRRAGVSEETLSAVRARAMCGGDEAPAASNRRAAAGQTA